MKPQEATHVLKLPPESTESKVAIGSVLCGVALTVFLLVGAAGTAGHYFPQMQLQGDPALAMMSCGYGAAALTALVWYYGRKQTPSSTDLGSVRQQHIFDDSAVSAAAGTEGADKGAWLGLATEFSETDDSDLSDGDSSDGGQRDEIGEGDYLGLCCKT